MILVNLATASICFLNQCYPALVGPDTPAGQFRLEHVSTQEAGYGGDVLVFKESSDTVWAIHRVWLLDLRQRRLERLTSDKKSERTTVTLGCINVMPEVYEKLVACCRDGWLVVVSK